MTKYEDLIKQRKKKSISLEAIFRKYKMSVNDVKNIQDEIENVKKEADRLMIDKITKYEKEINECYNRIADLTESLKSKDYFRDPDYKYLIDENHRLEQEILETKADNIKLSRQIEDKMDQLRRSGVI